MFFTSVVQSKRNGWWPKPLISFVRVYINKPEQYIEIPYLLLMESGQLCVKNNILQCTIGIAVGRGVGGHFPPPPPPTHTHTHTLFEILRL